MTNLKKQSMKHILCIALIGINLMTSPAFSELSEPSYPLSQKAKVALLGAADAARARGDFTCSQLLTKTWAYPNAQVLALCYDAERSCYAFTILRDKLAQQKKKNLEEDTSFISAQKDAQFRLTSCLLAIEDSGLQGESTSIPSFGPYINPLLPLTPAPF